ncbi:MAG: hypothetical protein WC256_05385 [Desulfurivibrionaceae bacterium]
MRKEAVDRLDFGGKTATIPGPIGCWAKCGFAGTLLDISEVGMVEAIGNGLFNPPKGLGGLIGSEESFRMGYPELYMIRNLFEGGL